jgi:hypothetical protein
MFVRIDIDKCLVTVKYNPFYLTAFKFVFPFFSGITQNCDFSFVRIGFVV